MSFVTKTWLGASGSIILSESSPENVSFLNDNGGGEVAAAIFSDTHCNQLSFGEFIFSISSYDTEMHYHSIIPHGI